MGSTPSKPAETKVFTPTTPVEISNNLISQLEGSVESDYTRSQYTEAYIQQRVEQQLQQLQGELQDNFRKELENSLIKEDTTPVSSSLLEQQLAVVKDKLSALTAKVEQRDLSEAKAAVLECFKNNQGKPLNCWEEVENFKKLAK